MNHVRLLPGPFLTRRGGGATIDLALEDVPRYPNRSSAPGNTPASAGIVEVEKPETLP